VADTDDDRDGGIGDRSHDALVVEAPQVLERTAAAREDDRIEIRLGVQALERADDRGGRCGALHDAGTEDHVDERVAAAQYVADVAPHGPDRGRDDADAPRPARDRPLPLVVEQAGGRQLRPQLLVAGVEIAGAGGRQGLDIELIHALRLIGTHAAMDDDLHAVHRPNRSAGELLAEQCGLDLAVGVLEGEEAMARGRE
jgi:hypothetical protein